MKKTVLIYGLMSGVIVSLWMSIAMLTSSGNHDDLSTSMFIGFLGMFIAFIFIFVAIKNYRDKINGGTVSFGKAFIVGSLVALIASLCYVATWAVVYHSYLPNFMQDYASHAIQEYKASGMPETELQLKIEEMNSAAENYKNPFYFVAYTLMEILPLGLVVSLIAALVFKRKSRIA